MADKTRLPHTWRTLSRAVAYNRRIQVIEELVGTRDDEFVYIYVKSAHDVVATLAITDERTAVLVREYRHPIPKPRQCANHHIPLCAAENQKKAGDGLSLLVDCIVI